MTRREAASIAGILSGCAVIALVFSMVNSSLCQVGKSLGLSLNTLQWMMSTFGIINASTLVTFGRLADIYGRKKIFLIGIFSSLVGMIGGGFATSGFSLILSMAFAGVGNGIILPVSQAMLLQEFSEEKKGTAIGLWTQSIGACLAIGPILGGLISANFGVSWVFFSVVPIIVASFFLVLLYSKESVNTLDSKQLDIQGMLALFFAISSFVVTVTEHRSLSFGAILFLVVIFLGSSFALVKIEKVAKEPILRPDLLKNKQFVAASMACSALVFFIWALFFLLPLYLQDIRGLTPSGTGLVMLAITVPVALFSKKIGSLAENKRRGNIGGIWVTGGFVLALISVLSMLTFDSNTGIFLIVVATLAFGIAYSCIWGPSTLLAVSSQPKERAALIAGTFVTLQEIGGTLALATSVTLMQQKASLEQGFVLSLLPLLVVAVLGVLTGLWLCKGKLSLSFDNL
jgi:MFS family permease